MAPEGLGPLVTSYLAIGDLKQAKEFADKLVSVSPSTNSYALRALVMEARGQDQDAIQNFKLGIAAESGEDLRESVWIRNLFARFCMNHAMPTEARLLLSEALRLSPSDPMALGLRGEFGERIGDYENAIADYERAFENSKQIPFLTGQARNILRKKVSIGR